MLRGRLAAGGYVSDSRATSPNLPPLARVDLIAAAVLLLAAFAIRGLWFGDPVADFDDQLYSFIGWRMTQGDWPYVDQWDRKPFGLFVIFAIAHWIGGPGPAAYQVLATLSVFGGALLVYALARLLVDRFAAAVAGVLYMVLVSAYGSYVGQTETFHTPLMLLMLWLVRDWRREDAARRALIAMAIGGVALQIKYTVLPQCLFFGAYALWGQWRRGMPIPKLALLASAFAALGVLPTALVGLLYAAIGQFEPFWYANFVSFFARLPAPLGRIGNVRPAALLPYAVLLTLGLIAAWRLNPPRDRGTYLLFVAWLLAAIASVLFPSTVYLYYYSALAAPVVLVALPLLDGRRIVGTVAAIMLVAGGLYLLRIPHRLEITKAERRNVARLTQAIRPHVDATRECLYVFDGPTVLYRTTGTCVPTRFVYPDHLNNNLETHSLGVDQVAEVRRILATRPAVIVTADKFMTPQRPENLAQVHQRVSTAYRPLATEWLHGRRITAWLRNDLPGPDARAASAGGRPPIVDPPAPPQE
ncbi:MAG: hypothetical protein B7Z33_04155 [Sphingomonadales bacterium 12-68-11]|nr:MAG: hypothetical protein B7Z33_04155 [Sphingomonadales bacterium 12-68-11]